MFGEAGKYFSLWCLCVCTKQNGVFQLLELSVFYTGWGQSAGKQKTTCRSQFLSVSVSLIWRGMSADASRRSVGAGTRFRFAAPGPIRPLLWAWTNRGGSSSVRGLSTRSTGPDYNVSAETEGARARAIRRTVAHLLVGKTMSSDGSKDRGRLTRSSSFFHYFCKLHVSKCSSRSGTVFFDFMFVTLTGFKYLTLFTARSFQHILKSNFLFYCPFTV